MLWTVQYLCQYSPIWRDAAETFIWEHAVRACRILRATRGRPARIIDDFGREVYRLP